MEALQQAIIGLLALVVLVLFWLGYEVRKLNASIGPLVGSPAARAIAGFGDAL